MVVYLHHYDGFSIINQHVCILSQTSAPFDFLDDLTVNMRPLRVQPRREIAHNTMVMGELFFGPVSGTEGTKLMHSSFGVLGVHVGGLLSIFPLATIPKRLFIHTQKWGELEQIEAKSMKTL